MTWLKNQDLSNREEIIDIYGKLIKNQDFYFENRKMWVKEIEKKKVKKADKLGKVSYHIEHLATSIERYWLCDARAKDQKFHKV